jgi:hypothetical protein
MIVTLEEDNNGDLILPLSDELMRGAGWEVGDTLVWKDLGDGSWSISKKEDFLDDISEAVAQLWKMCEDLKAENADLRKEINGFKSAFIGDNK